MRPAPLDRAAAPIPSGVGELGTVQRWQFIALRARGFATVTAAALRRLCCMRHGTGGPHGMSADRGIPDEVERGERCDGRSHPDPSRKPSVRRSRGEILIPWRAKINSHPLKRVARQRAGLVIRFLSIRPRFCFAFPSDLTSRRCPCASPTLRRHWAGIQDFDLEAAYHARHTANGRVEPAIAP